ncbi:hypothetical protein [Cellulomonas sp.]|uniref:hypothetical protein n=1 Tax=Cellulomonas sp. TaxID=40001 RepID=UPI003BA8D017
MTTQALDDLAARWLARWPDALAAWGRTSRMHAPVLHTEPCGMPSWAWYTTDDVEVHIDLTVVVERGIEDHALAVLAHEIGHHLLAPVDRLTSLKIAARVKVGLVDMDHLIGLVANLWCDLLINDRLQRRAGVDRASLAAAVGTPDADNVLGLLVGRTYEILWGLPRGRLSGAGPASEEHAHLCARLVRAYARDPVGGAAGFARLVRGEIDPEWLRAPESAASVGAMGCGGDQGGDGGVPFGLASDPTLTAPATHPALDPRVVGATGVAAPETATEGAAGGGNGLEPAALHALLTALGSTTSAQQVAAAWYRERAAPHLVPFPVREGPTTSEQLLGGLDPWEVGDDLSAIDWSGTMAASPVVVPGMTTVQRAYLEDEQVRSRPRPVDLDLYLDSSGSMANPSVTAAPIALAGAVLALSALRSGARVQATTWSGSGQAIGTDGFTRDVDAVMAAVVAYIGGGTSFPLALLERTHLGADGKPPTTTGPTHIAVISDDGVSTMFRPETGWQAGKMRTVGSDIATRALEAAGGGGSLVLRISPEGRHRIASMAGRYRAYAVQTDPDLVTFARDFSRATWGGGDHGRR